MSLKGKGLYRDVQNYIMKWDQDRLWYVWPDENNFTDLWLKKDAEGWSGEFELEGAALVAPLSILFWEDE